MDTSAHRNPLEPAEDWPSVDIEAELSDYELTIRKAMGFNSVSVASLVASGVAEESAREWGFRMTAPELEEMRARRTLQVFADEFVLSSQRPPGFGGFYFDSMTGQYVIQTTGDPKTAFLYVEQHLPADRIRVESVDYEHSHLRQLADSILSFQDGQLTAESANSEFGKHSDLISIGVIDRENRVLVLIHDDLPGHLRDRLERLGDAVVIGQLGDTVLDHCTQASGCAPPMRPGQRIDPRLGYSTGTCTLGGGFRNNSTGVEYLSTAGHCAINYGSTVESTWNDVMPGIGGVTEYTRARYTPDASLVRNNSSLDLQLSPFPGGLIGNNPWGTSSKLTSSYWYNGLTPGTAITISRGKTGGVATTEFYDYMSHGSRVIGQNKYWVTNPGDSGGPWFANSKYAGNHIGQRWLTIPGLPAAYHNYFEQVQVSENYWGVTYKGTAAPAERLYNKHFDFGLNSPTGWAALPGPGGGVAMGRVNDVGHYRENSLNGWCTGQPHCSYYQDMPYSISSSQTVSVGVWIYCQSTSSCLTSVVLWGLGGSQTPKNINRLVTVPAGEGVYVAFEGSVAGSHPNMRFQVYHHHVNSVPWISTPTVRK